MIGQRVEVQDQGAAAWSDEDGGGEIVRSEIDFGTGKLLVDVIERTEWYGRTVLNSRTYSEVLYSDDGISMEHRRMKRYWSQDLSDDFKKIKDAQAETVTISGAGAGSAYGSTGSYDDGGDY